MKKQLMMLIFLVTITLQGFSQQTPTARTHAARNKEVVRKILQAFDSGDTTAFNHLISKNAVSHMPMSPGIESTGLQAVKDMAAMHQKSFSNTKTKVHVMATAGDTVMAYYTTTATNSGMFMGRPATNKTINVDGVDILLIKNGKAVEHWGVSDTFGMMQQLGMVPPSPMAPAANQGPEKNRQ